MKTIGSLVLLASVCVTGASPATCPTLLGRGYSTYSYAPTYYATPVLLADYGYHAAYSVGYAPDSTDVLKAFHDDAIKAKDETIATLKAALASGAVPPELRAAMKPAHPGISLIGSTCMSCHSASDGARKGGKHVMWEGDAFVGTGKQLEECRNKIEDGSMPPGTKWSWEQKAMGISGLTRMKIKDDSPKITEKEMPKTDLKK